MATRILIACGLMFVLGACTRPDMDQSKVSISLPSKSTSGKVDAQGAEVLSHVVINVTGAGMNPFVFNWDKHSSPVAPNEFFFDFQQGSGRLVQVLAVYQDATTQAMSFYYGDTTADFNTSAVTLFINVSSLSSGYTASGKVAGRYLTAANSGPTGGVDITYTPPNRPPMIIERSFIYNGWFNLFGLSDVDMTYRLFDGTILFGGPVRLGDTAIFPNSSGRIVKLQMPLHLSERDGVDQPSEPSFMIWGWFGASTFTAGKYVCLDSVPSTLSEYDKYGAAGTSLVLSSQSSMAPTVSMFDPSDSSTSLFGGTGSLAYRGLAIRTGGVLSSDSSCTSATEYVSKLTLGSLQFNKARDGGALLYGPLRLKNTTDGGAFSESSPNILEGQLLPDLVGQISRVRIVGIPTDMISQFDHIESNSFPCGLVQGLPGFVEDVPDSSGLLSFDFTSAPPIFATHPSVAVCFARPDGSYYPMGFLKRDGGSGGGGGGGSSGPYLRIEFMDAYSDGGDTYELTVGKCHTINPRVYNSGSLDATYAGTVSIVGGSGFYSDAACTSSFSGGVGISAGVMTSPTNLYYKESSERLTAVNIVGVTVPVGLQWSPSYNQILAYKPNLTLSLPMSGSYEQNGCYPFKAYLASRSGQYGSFQSATDIDLSVPANFAVYSDGVCSAPVSVIHFVAAMGESSQLYLKPTGTSAFVTLGLSGGNAGLVNYNPVQVSALSSIQSSAPVNVSVDRLDAMTQLDRCHRVVATLRNKDGHVVTAPGPGVTIPIYVENVRADFWWGTSGCMSGSSQTVYFPSGESTRYGYMRISGLEGSTTLGGAASAIIKADMPNGGATVSVGGPFTVNAPSSSQYIFISNDFTVDQKNASLVGSHDFTKGYVKSKVNYSGGTFVTCSEDSGVTWGNCSGRLYEDVGIKYFKFLASDIGSAWTPFYLKVSEYAGGTGRQRQISVRLSDFFKSGTQFVACNAVVTTSGTTQDLDSALAARSAGQVVCVDDGLTFSFDPNSSPQVITNWYGRSLVASFKRTTKLQQTGNTGSLFSIAVGDGSNLTRIANFEIDQTLATAGSGALYLSTATALNVESSNNWYRANGGTGKAMYLSNMAAVISKRDRFSNLSEKPFWVIEPQFAGEALGIEGGLIEPAGSGEIPFVFYSKPSATFVSTLRMEKTHVNGKAGLLYQEDQSSCASCGIVLRVLDSKVIGTGRVNAVGMVYLDSSGSTRLDFKRSAFHTSGNSPFIHLSGIYLGQATFGDWEHLRFEHSSAHPFLRRPTGTYTPFYFQGTFNDVHITRLGGGAAELFNVDSSTGASADNTAMSGIRYCASAGHSWSLNSYINTGDWAIVVPSSNVDSTNMLCY